MSKETEKDEDTTDPSVAKKLRRKEITKKTKKCGYCPPHSGENTTWSKRGVRKPKGKNKRRL